MIVSANTATTFWRHHRWLGRNLQCTIKLEIPVGHHQFAFGQSGASAPPVAGVKTVPLTAPIPAFGPCPGTTLTSRAIDGSAVITGTANFFAGMRASGFAGRDTNGAPAGRIWLNCSFCGMTQYSPAVLRQIGLGGNWMIRVTVEEQNCIPVELMGFDVG